MVKVVEIFPNGRQAAKYLTANVSVADFLATQGTGAPVAMALV